MFLFVDSKTHNGVVTDECFKGLALLARENTRYGHKTDRYAKVSNNAPNLVVSSSSGASKSYFNPCCSSKTHD